jgi:type IV secretory pathway VirB4 component
MLIVDEAWQLMKYEDSANFLFSLAKRARKYYLGLTTITQDVEDFMGSKMGRAIVANSSMQLLLKQSSSAVDVLSDVFKLTEEEKKRLANFPVGQGLFFAGQNHVHIQIIASQTETGLISTNPTSNNRPQPPVNDTTTGGYVYEIARPQDDTKTRRRSRSAKSRR